MGKIKANDKTNIEEIVEKISANQQEIETIDSTDYIEQTVVPSLEYYLVIASDFTKLIKQLMKFHKQEFVEGPGKIVRGVESELSVMGVEVFKRLVVFDSLRHEALAFIKDSLKPLMTKAEMKSLVFKIIEDFLSRPHENFSQVAVLQSL